MSAALPECLREIGLDARVLLPGYPAVLDADRGAREIARITVAGRSVRLLETRLPGGMPLMIVDAPTLFARSGGPYQDGEVLEEHRGPQVDRTHAGPVEQFFRHPGRRMCGVPA